MTALTRLAERPETAASKSPAEAAATLRGLANGLRVSPSVFVAAQLHIADHLSQRPSTASSSRPPRG